MANNPGDAGSRLSARLDREGEIPGVVADEELDLSTKPRLKDEFRRAAEQAGTGVVADLSSVSFMDSSGLELLIE